jgi:TPR repeat protein
MTRPRLALPLLLALALPRPLAAQPLELAFLPPAVEPQDLCSATPAEVPGDPGAAAGAATDEAMLFLRFLRRDIRNLAAEDADRWFDFIQTLITWQAELDPNFAGAAELLARIALHVDAGRLDALRAAGLIDQLRQGSLRMNGPEKLALAQYYLNGTGVDQDIPYAQSLIRDAAYGGTVDALLTVARMEVEGHPMPGWDAPLDLTVSLAFGGMLGQMDAGVCARAERIAREYLSGSIVARNPATAYAWHRFAADLGGAGAAWRVVEYHLGAAAPAADNAVLLKYLGLAARSGFQPNAAQTARLRAAGSLSEADLAALLGPNTVAPEGEGRPSVARHFRLAINPDAQDLDESGPYLAYLRKLATFDTAPGWVFTRLANEVQVRQGRWKGEAETVALLETAAARGDGAGMQLLAGRLLRYRQDPAQLARAINLLTEAATTHGLTGALRDLDGLYRCQAPAAPMRREADYWAGMFRASDTAPVEIGATDLLVLDPWREPETIARIQSQALQGQPQALSQQLERVQVDALAGEDADRTWVARTQVSDKALELFAELEFTLATTPAERDLAIELFRRVYLNNGVTTALDLAVALVEHNGRDPAIAAEIVTLLTQAGNRGEGAAIRLLARLMDDHRSAAQLGIAPQTEAETYTRFATAIEDRGDFLALMFAIPHVAPERAADYTERAVSQMTCGTKDADELGDAASILQSAAASDHWRRVGLAVEGYHVLSRLALTNRQMEAWGTRAAPDRITVLAREMAEGDGGARRSLWALTANPDLAGYDPAAAADHLLALVQGGNASDEAFVLTAYREAPPAVRAAVAARFDMGPIYRRAAEAGRARAQLDLALLLRAQAKGPADLAASAGWLEQAAKAGDVTAMAELGRVMAGGLGLPADRDGALHWLDQAGTAGDAGAAELARLLRLSGGP